MCGCNCKRRFKGEGEGQGPRGKVVGSRLNSLTPVIMQMLNPDHGAEQSSESATGTTRKRGKDGGNSRNGLTGRAVTRRRHVINHKVLYHSLLQLVSGQWSVVSGHWVDW